MVCGVQGLLPREHPEPQGRGGSPAHTGGFERKSEFNSATRLSLAHSPALGGDDGETLLGPWRLFDWNQVTPVSGPPRE